MLALDVRNLNKHYPHFQLKDVSFQLEQGYIMGFIGANGAGKTTTIKSILNMIHTDGGEVRILGKSMAEHELQLKQEIGFAFGDIDFYTRSKDQDIDRRDKRFYKHWDEDAYRGYLKRFKLDETSRSPNCRRG